MFYNLVFFYPNRAFNKLAVFIINLSLKVGSAKLNYEVVNTPILGGKCDNLE